MNEWIIPDDFLDEDTKLSADGQGFLYELIRCKDCTFYLTGKSNTGDHNDFKWCKKLNMGTDEYKYCAWAEQRK